MVLRRSPCVAIARTAPWIQTLTRSLEATRVNGVPRKIFAFGYMIGIMQSQNLAYE
jgi:hypothetical protein